VRIVVGYLPAAIAGLSGRRMGDLVLMEGAAAVLVPQPTFEAARACGKGEEASRGGSGRQQDQGTLE